MNEKNERHLRRKAIRLMLQDEPTRVILHTVKRGRTWWAKWRQRFLRWGWPGLRSQSRRPAHRPPQYPQRVRHLVQQVRRHLQRRRVGLVGAKAIQQELRHLGGVRRLPSVSTIKPILHEGHLAQRAGKPQRRTYYPKPHPTARYRIQAMDWTEKYLPGGAKVYAFHSLDLSTRACVQTLQTDKTYATALTHALTTWQKQGLPAAVQVDNDAAFTGGNKTPRRVSQFVRLCLYLGIELIFIPPGEPQRNGEVERLNGLWAQAFWQRQHFTSLAQVQRQQAQFEAWYARTYPCPPEAQHFPPLPPLTAQHILTLPEPLPVTAGRIHFIRQVQADGTITFLQETWPVHKRLAGQYVWATIWTARQVLEIWYRRGPQEPLRLMKTYPYLIAESVLPLAPAFQREGHRRKLSAMS